MTERINPFANLTEPPSFATKAKKEVSAQNDTVERIAEQNNFPSRQARATKVERRKPRVYRTGRNQQFNAKVTAETFDRFYKTADAKKVTLGELMKLALDALDAVDSLQKLADKKHASLQTLVSQALDALA